MSKRNVFFLALVVLLVLSIGNLSGESQTASSINVRSSMDRIRGPIVDTDTVPLYGNVHPLARAQWDRGAVEPGLTLKRMALLLQPSPNQEAAAANLAAAQQNPASAFYHKWITPAEYAAQFGASAGDVAKIQSWLQSHGFSVEPVSPNQRLMYFSGTASQVTSAFHTEMHNYVVNGEHHIANAQSPQIPRALASVVAGVVSLHDFRHQSMLHVRPMETSPQNTGTQTGSTGLFPADFGVIYDLTSTWGTSYAGNIGTGVTIGIVGRSNIVLTDISTFQSTTHLPTNAPTVDFGGVPQSGTDPGLVAGDQDEATLDVEWSDAVAPGASIILAPVASTDTTDGVDLSATYLVNKTNPPQIISVSFGSCEQKMGATELAFFNSLWQQAAMQGESVLVASGDSGAAGCDAGSASAGTQAAVNGICSSPYATCVGGTEFDDTASPSSYWNSTNNSSGASAKSYIPEVVWNESGSNGGSELWASGGGISLVYPQPSWQSVADGTRGQRAVPDVALTAASHDGYVGYETIGSTPSWLTFAGTSAATPSYAGIVALISKANGATPQGNVNPIIYGLASSSTAAIFHPTVSGDNGVPSVAGFWATNSSYNLATGLGSVDGKLLISNWASSSGLTSFALQAASSSLTLNNGAGGNVSISVHSVDSAKASVLMAYTAPSGVTVAFKPATVTASATASTVATISVDSDVQPGNYIVLLTGTAGTTTETVQLALTVTEAPELSLHAASSIVQVTQGAAVPLVFNVTTSGIFSGSVSLRVASGLPTGVTASWSSATLTPSSDGTLQSTLTLTALSTAAPQTATITVTATGDNLTATDVVSVQVLQAPTVEVTASSASLTMSATGTVVDNLLIYTLGGLSGTTALTVSGLPTGVTASFGPISILSPGAASANITFAGGPTVAATSFTATITATTTMASKAYVGTAKVVVAITKAPPTITFLANTAKLNLVQGSSATTVVSFMTGGTFTGTVTLQPVAVTGLPTGTTAAWTPGSGITVSAGVATVTVTNGLGTATLTLTAPAATPNKIMPTSIATLNIKAAGTTSTTASATEILTVTMLYSPQIMVTPSLTSLSMASAQQSVVENFTITPMGGYVPTSIVATIPSNWPTGITPVYTNVASSTGAVTANGSSAVNAVATINGSANALASAARNLVFTFLAKDKNNVASTITMTVPLTVTLSPPTLTVSSGTAFTTASPLSVMQGTTSTADVITVAAGGSFATGTKAGLTVTGLPAGVTANWSTNLSSSTSTSTTVTPAVVSGGPDQITSSLTLTVSPTAVVPAAAATITITAQGVAPEAAASGSIAFPLKLTYAPGLLVQPQAAAVSIASAGTSSAEIVKITAVGSPTILVPVSTVLSIGGLPTGITGHFSALSASGLTGNSTLTLTGSNAAVANTTPATVTITATSTDASSKTYVNTATFTLAVSLSAPTLAVSSGTPYTTSSPLSIMQGKSATDAITVTAGGSFAPSSTASLVLTGLPAGVTANWSTNAGSSTSTTTTVTPITSGGTDQTTPTLTLTVSPTAVVPTSTAMLTITATGNGAESAATTTKTIPLVLTYAPQVSVTPQTASISMTSAGSSSAEVVKIAALGSMVPTLTSLSVSGLPNNITGSFSGFSGTTGNATLNLTGSSSAVATSVPVTVTVTATALDENNNSYQSTGTFALTVTLTKPTLTVADNSGGSLSIVQGSSGTDVITVTAGGSFAPNSLATVTVSGLPTGVTANWSTNASSNLSASGTLTPSSNSTSSISSDQASATLTLAVSPTAVIPASATKITITATGQGSQSAASGSMTIPLTLTYSPALQLSIASASATVASAANNVASPVLTVTGVGGVNATSWINWTVSGLPSGMTGYPSPKGSSGSSQTWQIMFTGSNTIAAGTYPLTITAQGTQWPWPSGMNYGTPATVKLSLTVTKSAATLTILPSSATPTVSKPASGTNAVTDQILLTGGGSYTGAVTLSLSALPSGITANWDNATPTPVYSSYSLTSTATPTLTLTAASTAVVGTYPITITAKGDSLTATSIINLNVGNASLSVSSPAPTQSVIVPASSTNAGTFTINAATGGTFSGNVAFSVTSTLPSGVTAGWSASPVTPSNGSASSTLTLTVGTTASVSTYPITVQASGNGLTSITTVYLVTTATPTLSIAPVYTSPSVTIPSSATNAVSTPINVTTGGTFSGPVNLMITSIMPTGVTSNWTGGATTFTPSTYTGATTGSSSLTMTVGTGATAGSYTVYIAASGAGVNSATSFTLVLLATPTLTVSLNPSSLTVISPASGTNSVSGAVTLTGNSTYTGAATLSVVASGLPVGITPNASPNPVTISGTTGASMLSLAAGTTAVPGTYTITLQATGGNASGSTSVTLIVSAKPTLTISATTTTPSVASPATGTNTITDVISLTGNSTFSGTVTPNISGLPTGVTASWSPTSVSLSGNSKNSSLLLTAATSAVPGSYPLTISASGDGASGTQNITLTVTAKPTLSLVSAVTGTKEIMPIWYMANVTQSQEAVFTFTDNVTVTTGGTFTGSPTLSVSGLPYGITASFDTTTPTITSNTGSATLTVTMTSNYSQGYGQNYPITITATGNGVTTPIAAFTLNTTWPDIIVDTMNTGMGYSSSGSMSIATGTTTLGYIAIGCGNQSTAATTFTVSYSGLPTGITASSFGGTCGASMNVYDTFSVTANHSTATAGTTVITVSATGSNGAVSTAKFTLTVTP